jgi:hypothetical protein
VKKSKPAQSPVQAKAEKGTELSGNWLGGSGKGGWL